MKIKTYVSPTPNGPLLITADNFESTLPTHPYKQEWQLGSTTESSRINLSQEDMAAILAKGYCITQRKIIVTETEGVTLPASIGKPSRG